MKLHVTFGMALDGVRDLDRQLAANSATLGSLICGPATMLPFLETRLGLSGAEPSISDRIAAYQSKVQAADAAWCRASFAVDPWGTSARLLSLRDELVMMGWKPDEELPDNTRIGALARIERIAQDVPRGLADRLWAVAVSERDLDDEASIDFSDDPFYYPEVWKRIFARHFKVEIRKERENVCRESLPELTIVRAPDETRLAVELARFLKSGSSKDNSKVAVIARGDTTLLDGVFTRYGLPRIGRSSSSVYREVLEIVPLWIELMWKPIKPELLISLLGMTFGPLSRGNARILIKALNEMPGVGGEAWQRAWDKILEKVDTLELPETKKEEKKVRLGELKRVLEDDRYSMEDGIPSERLLAVMKLVRNRFDGKRTELQMRNRETGIKDERLVGLSIAIQQIDLLCAAVKTQESDTLGYTQLERILESVVGGGLGLYDAHEEIADYQVVRSPAQLMSPIKTVIWWDFTDQGCPRCTNWLEGELRNLPGREDANHARVLELQTWMKAVELAEERLVCFVPERKSGEIVAPHPYYDNLSQVYGDKIKSASYACDARILDGRRMLAGREIKFVEASDAVSFMQADDMIVAENKDLEPTSNLSATQLDVLVSCPFKWYLKYYLNLRDGDFNDVLQESLIKGKLAHKVMEDLFTRVNPKTPQEAAHAAGCLFEELVPQMAAIYDAAERRDGRRVFKKQLCSSVENLFVQIQCRGLKFEGAEVKLKKEFAEGLDFEGTMDLILRDDVGKKFIIDYKWTSKSDKYSGPLKEGKSIQLAAYDWLLSDGSFGISSAYYFLPQLELVENDQCAAKPKQNDGETWRKVQDTYDHAMKEMQQGVVRKGVPDEVFAKFSNKKAKGQPLSPKGLMRNKILTDKGVDINKELDKAPSCYFCPYKAICGDVVEIENEDGVEKGDVQ